MTKEFMEKLIAEKRARLQVLDKETRDANVTEDQLKAIAEEVNTLNADIKTLNDSIAEITDTDDSNPDDSKKDDSNSDDETKSDDKDDEDDKKEDGKRSNKLDVETRSAIQQGIKEGMSMNSKANEKKREARQKQVFAQMLMGNKVSDMEARQLGIVSGNGSVTVPKVIAKEWIAYAQEENPLRQLGTLHQDTSTEGYPVLIKKLTANGHSAERNVDNPIPDGSIELDEVVLDPQEFDALALVTKKLLTRSGSNVESEVLKELNRAYVEKEANFMFNGTDEGNINEGSLSKKAVEFKPAAMPDLTSGQAVYDTLVNFKNSVKSSVRKSSTFVINDAALTLIETMKTDDGFPLFKPFEGAANGPFDGKILGYNAVVSEYANIVGDEETPVMYFGDFKSFHIQDVLGTMEVTKLVERYADSNQIGYKIYNLLDGQLIYSPLEPTMFKFVLKATNPDPDPKE